MKYIESEIKELIFKAREGDTKSINEFIQLHEALNRYVITKLIHNTGTHFNMEELESIGLMGVYKGIESWDEGRGSVKNHIAFKIKGEVKNFLRGNSFVVKADMRYTPSQSTTDIFDDTFEMDNSYENNDTRSHLRDVLSNHMSKLNERQYSVLYGLYFDDLNYAELSEKLELPLTSIYSTEKGALKKLKKYLTS